MKNAFLVMVIVFCFCNIANAAFFNPLDSTTISFTTLSFLGATDYGDDTRIEFGIRYEYPPSPFPHPGYFPVGSFRFDVYENGSDPFPTSSQILGPNTIGYIFVNGPKLVIDNSGNITVIPQPTLWSDAEGKIVVTMLTGTMTMDYLKVQVTSEGQLYGQPFDITSVTPTPIPGAALLLGSGLFGLASIRRRRVMNTRSGSLMGPAYE